MHEIIVIYKMCLGTLHMFRQRSCHLQGAFISELQERYTTVYLDVKCMVNKHTVYLDVKRSRSSVLKTP
jgi:hypothetical protein